MSPQDRAEQIMSKDYNDRTPEDEAEFMRLTLGSLFDENIMSEIDKMLGHTQPAGTDND